VKKFAKYQVFWPLLILIAIWCICEVWSLCDPRFQRDWFNLTIRDNHLYGFLVDVFRNGSTYMLLAMGLTMVLATAGTDISVGAVMAISSSIACSIIDNRILPGLGGSLAGAVIVALIAGLLCGLWNGTLVSKLKMPPIVATMILLTGGRGIAQLIADGKIVTINTAANGDAYYFLSGGFVFGLPFPIFIVAFLLIAILLFTKLTSFGVSVEASGCNPTASRFAGINVDILKIGIYVFCGLTAAVAGLVESAGIKGADCNNIGLMNELYGILAVALGGTSLAGGRFSITASVIGAVIVQTIETFLLAVGVAPQAIKVAMALMILVICLAQSKRSKHLLALLGIRIKGVKAVAKA
jgi:simple sugar transport system permease protein